MKEEVDTYNRTAPEGGGRSDGEGNTPTDKELESNRVSLI